MAECLHVVNDEPKTGDDPALETIRQSYGITYRHTLAEPTKLDSAVTAQPNVF